MLFFSLKHPIRKSAKGVVYDGREMAPEHVGSKNV